MLLDEEYMLKAIALAKAAAALGECPVGAVVVDGAGKIVGEGYNLREKKQSPLSHAEIEAITAAADKLGTWRLSDCTIYVTLEPCPMCAGAIINARIKRVVFGAFDEKGGACSSVLEMFEYPFSHKPLLRSRILEKECSALLTDFFGGLR